MRDVTQILDLLESLKENDIPKLLELYCSMLATDWERKNG